MSSKFRDRLPWPDEEIVQSWREAADQDEQIKILAQLNACTIDRIESILLAAGCNIKASARRISRRGRGKKGRWTPEEDTELITLRDAGYTWMEIAGQLRRSKSSCVSREHYIRERGRNDRDNRA
jgi:hypothetical protein